MQVFDHDEYGMLAASVANEVSQDVGLALIADALVHGVDPRFELQRLRQVEEIVEENPFVGRRALLAHGQIRGKLTIVFARAGREVQQPPGERALHLFVPAGAKVENKRPITTESLLLGEHCGFLEQACLSDAGFTAHEYDVGTTWIPAGVEHALNLDHLDSTANESCRVLPARGVAKGPNPLHRESSTAEVQDQLGDRLRIKEPGRIGNNRLRSEYLTGTRHVLELVCHVHAFTGYRVFALPGIVCTDHHLSGSHTHVGNDGMGNRLGDLRGHGSDIHGGAQRALGIVAVGEGDTEQGDDRISDPIINLPSVTDYDRLRRILK